MAPTAQAQRSRLPLLVVDGYNVLYASETYLELVDRAAPHSLSHDPFDRARERLLADVASFAHESYEAVIVYDGASNPRPERLTRKAGGVEVRFSRAGHSADALIEAMVTQAREQGREVTVVTSDNVIRSTVAGSGVSYISSRLLVREIELIEKEREQDEALAPRQRMSLEDRLDPKSRAKLEKFIGKKRADGSAKEQN